MNKEFAMKSKHHLAGIEEAEAYLRNMSRVSFKLRDPSSVYYGRAGHLRLARECGYALNDFNDKAQELILKSSYGRIYVTGCMLRPILNASEWMDEMRSQILIP